jgi:hypothetical protein
LEKIPNTRTRPASSKLGLNTEWAINVVHSVFLLDLFHPRGNLNIISQCGAGFGFYLPVMILANHD